MVEMEKKKRRSPKISPWKANEKIQGKRDDKSSRRGKRWEVERAMESRSVWCVMGGDSECAAEKREHRTV